MARKIIVQEGTGAVIRWKYPNTPKLTQLPIQITQIAHNSQDTPSIPTSHLGSLRPRPGEVGGQTFQPGLLENPGMLVIDAFFDPSIVMPRGLMILHVVYRRLSGFAIAARFEGTGFFTTESHTIPLSAAMTTSKSIQLSGVFRFVPAQRTTNDLPVSIEV